MVREEIKRYEKSWNCKGNHGMVRKHMDCMGNHRTMWKS